MRHGNLYVKGGIINSANSYAIQNWKNATIKDNAVINGNVSTWTYDGGQLLTFRFRAALSTAISSQ